MHITNLLLSKANLHDALLPQLRGRVFHISRLSNLDSIKESGEIKPNQEGLFESTFGSSENSFFRNLDCVSLFDYRSVTPEELDISLTKCSPFQPTFDHPGIAIFFVATSIYPALLTWPMVKKETKEVTREMIVPHVEAGHPGPILLASIDEIISVEVDEDPDPLVEILRRGRKKNQKSE